MSYDEHMSRLRAAANNGEAARCLAAFFHNSLNLDLNSVLRYYVIDVTVNQRLDYAIKAMQQNPQLTCLDREDVLIHGIELWFNSELSQLKGRSARALVLLMCFLLTTALHLRGSRFLRLAAKFYDLQNMLMTLMRTGREEWTEKELRATSFDFPAF